MAFRFGREGRDDSEQAGIDEIGQKTSGDVPKIVERESMILKSDLVTISEVTKNEMLGGEKRGTTPEVFHDIHRRTHCMVKKKK